MRKENLNYLIDTLEKANSWISAREIASQMHTTARTVRSYVAAVNEMYAGNFILTSHEGYRLNPDYSENLHPLFPLENKFLQTKEDRIWYILKTLAYCDHNSGVGVPNISFFCDRLAISDKTLESDLAIVRKMLLLFHLRLQSKEESLYLAGSEGGIRRLVFSCFFHFTKDGFLRFSWLKGALKELPADEIKTAVEEELHNSKLESPSCFRECLFLHMFVQLLRIQRSCLISQEECQLPCLKHLPEYTAALNLASRLQKLCQVIYSPAETDWLAILLLCYCQRNDKLPLCWEESYKIAKECLGRVGRMEEIDLSGNHLPERLADYISRLRIRCQYNMPIYNPIASSLRNGSPLIYDDAAWVMTYIRRLWQIQPSRDELGFLTILLMIDIKQMQKPGSLLPCTLICPYCFGLQASLKERLIQHFGRNIDIDILSEDSELAAPQGERIVISTIRLSHGKHYIYVTPSLTSSDLSAIFQEIRRLETRRRCERFKIYLECYSSDKLFLRNQSFASDTDVIPFLCEKLEAAGYVGKGFQELILEREAADSSSYHNLIAVPHAVNSSVYRNSICILLNDNPINWGNNRKVNLVVLVAMERELKDDFRLFYETLIYLFEDRKNMSKLLEVEDYFSFLSKIEKLIEI